jgi:hypothetical protein
MRLSVDARPLGAVVAVLAMTLVLGGCGGGGSFPAPPSLASPTSVTTEPAVTPDQALALSAVLAPSDVASEFDGSGGEPALVSPTQLLGPASGNSPSATALAARCDPDGALAGASAGVASAESTRFVATSPLELAQSASLVYPTERLAANVFVSLSAALPCIDQLVIGPAASGGEQLFAYTETPPSIGDQAAAIKLSATAAGGTIGAAEDEILVRVGRTLLLFSFADTPSASEQTMLASVIDRTRHAGQVHLGAL